MSPDDELERLLKVLIERYGHTRTLGETYASVCALRLCREGGTMSMAEFAKQTGISKKNLSRWAQNAVDRDRLKVREHALDGRMKDFMLTNVEDSSRHLPAIAEILGVPMEPPRKR